MKPEPTARPPFRLIDFEKQRRERQQQQELAAHRAKDAIVPLEALLDLARSGMLRGLVFAADVVGERSLLAGVCGSYKQDPLKAIGSLTTIQHRLVSAMEDEPGA